MMSIVIDPEFRILIPKLDEIEVKQLEENIVREGCINPLIIWKEENILVDGHHRYDICTKLGIEYKVEYISFPDRTAAKIWIYEHQIGTRNLTISQKAAIAVELEPLYAVDAEKRMLAGKVNPLARGREGWSGEQAGENYNVSGRSVARAKAIKERSPKVFESVKDGKLSVKAADQVSKLSDDRQTKVLENPEVAGKIASAMEQLQKLEHAAPGITDKTVDKILDSDKEITSKEAILETVEDEYKDFKSFDMDIMASIRKRKSDIEALFNGAGEMCFMPTIIEMVCSDCEGKFDVYKPFPSDSISCPFCQSNKVSCRSE